MSAAISLLGKKLGMTQVFNPDGSRVGVTAVEVGPCVVVHKRTEQRDGYTALQLGFEDRPERKVNRPQTGHFVVRRAPHPGQCGQASAALGGDSTSGVSSFAAGDVAEIL